MHMKMVHQESDLCRIEQLAHTIESALAQDSSITNHKKVYQIYDCSECGIIFSTIQEQKEHEEKHHTFSTEEKCDQISTKTLWSEDDAKLYKITTFPNSDGEPFGVTIKGRGKHIEAHNKDMDTFNQILKEKVTTCDDVKFTVNDKVKTNSLLKVTVTTPNNIQSHAEIEIHKPIDKRHKATIEIRKFTEYDYDSVIKVQEQKCWTILQMVTVYQKYY